ncbi:hypothetical protein ACSBR2_002400 [Camellia fascicularis]
MALALVHAFFQVPVHHVDQIVLMQALSAPVVTVASPSAVRLHFHGGNQICTKIIILFFLFSLELFLCVSPYLLKLIASRWRLQEWTDGLGTGLSIMMAKRNPSLVTTFAFLSCGYVCSSHQEVKSVVLRTLNRARLNVAIDSFLKTGPRFKDAFQDPNSYLAIGPIFEAHVLLHIIRSSNQASLVLESIEKMIIRCLCLLLLILKLILLNLIRSSQLYMGLLRAKLQNRSEISWRDAKYGRRIQELKFLGEMLLAVFELISFSSFFIF